MTIPIALLHAHQHLRFLEANGYEIECRQRFLPLTVKSKLPVSPLFDPIPGMEVAVCNQTFIQRAPAQGSVTEMRAKAGTAYS